MELLHELVPNATGVAALINPNYPEAETLSKELLRAANAIGLQSVILRASSESSIDAAYRLTSRVCRTKARRQRPAMALLMGRASEGERDGHVDMTDAASLA